GREEKHEQGCDPGAGDLPAGAASAGGACPVRGGGPTGDCRDLELSGVSAGTAPAGGAATPAQTDRTAAEGSAAAPGEELGRARSERLPGQAVQQLRTLLGGEFLERRENVLVFGPPGSGKTHSLCAVAQELVRTGRRFLFTTTALLVQELLAARRDLKLKALLGRAGVPGA